MNTTAPAPRESIRIEKLTVRTTAARRRFAPRIRSGESRFRFHAHGPLFADGPVLLHGHHL